MVYQKYPRLDLSSDLCMLCPSVLRFIGATMNLLRTTCEALKVLGSRDAIARNLVDVLSDGNEEIVGGLLPLQYQRAVSGSEIKCMTKVNKKYLFIISTSCIMI